MSRTSQKVKQKRGYPLPPGVTIRKDGINFSLFARNASGVDLIIDISTDTDLFWPTLEIPLDPIRNRTGDMWHILLETDRTDIVYGFKVKGNNTPTGNTYEPQLILIDPYCKSLLPRRWGEAAGYGKQPCCRLDGNNFDWENDRPLKTPLNETIIYELHVRGFTRDSSSGVSAPGTYAGIIEKIPYLKNLGITAVELLPTTEFDENDTVFQQPGTTKRLKNFWGYNPVSFFALRTGYAQHPHKAVNEFKNMVKALHRAGIEVYLDIVFNHSGEGGYKGTTSSFRGIDNTIYYLLDPQGEYQNFSGCGNTMNCNHPVVRDLIRDSLHYWVTEMHIDGFRFDLASILGRDRQGKVLANPPMIEIIGEDPVLRDTKLIAEAWDAAGLYQVGTFSSDTRWGEWNGLFRDNVRSFLVGQQGSISDLATRIAGSSDLYQTSGRSPLSSINFITSHDGFTLYDLVSYDRKHNKNNGEDNRDGENHNLSWNSGVEGKTKDKNIEQLRFRRMKTFVVLLLFSQGIPMICAGDEFGRSQNGNNNCWCQDNHLSWLDWSLLECNTGLHRFFQHCISLRKGHEIFRRDDFFQPEQNTNQPGITWQYLEPGTRNWDSQCLGLAFQLHSDLKKKTSSDFFFMFNSHNDQNLEFKAPEPPTRTRGWFKVIDTAAASPFDILTVKKAPLHQRNQHITVAPFSCIVLQSPL